MTRRLLLVMITIWVLFLLPIEAQDTTQPETIFSEITFARDITLQTNQPITPLIRFPNTVTVVVAIMDIQGLQEGATVTSQWLLNGEQQTASAYTHNSTRSDFRLWTNLANPNGIPAGTWSLRVLLNGDIVQTGTFEVTDGPFIFPIRFGTSCGNFSGELFGQTTNYDSGVTNIFAQIRYTNFPSGTLVEGVWQHDGTVLEGAGLPIQTTLSGTGQRCLRIGDTRGLASGTYTIAVKNAGNTIIEGDITVAAPSLDPEEGGSGE